MQVKSARCSYCLKKLSGNCVSCTQCPTVSLCVSCFVCGAEAGTHKKSHHYRIEQLDSRSIDGVFGTPIPWNSTEEVKLLDAVETFGYGNWNEIASQLSSHTALDCREHYEDFYIKGLIGKSVKQNASSFTAQIADHTKDTNELPACRRSFLTNEDERLLAYISNRDEFEYEYCNNAEKLIVTVPYGPILDELEKDLLVAMVDIYNSRLNERTVRHAIANEHGLIAYLMRNLSSARRNSRLIRSNRNYRCSNRKSFKRPYGRRYSSRSVTRRNKRKRSLATLSCTSSTNMSSAADRSVLPIRSRSSTTDNFSMRQTPRKLSSANARKKSAPALINATEPFHEKFLPLRSDSVVSSDLNFESAPHAQLLLQEVTDEPRLTGLSCSAMANRTHLYSTTASSTTSFSDNVDSGIGSGESCGHSTTSTGSNVSDSGIYPSAKASRFKRPRSSSACTDEPPLLTDPLAIDGLTHRRKRIHSVGSFPSLNAQPCEIKLCKPPMSCTVPLTDTSATTQLLTSTPSTVTIQNKRGRPQKSTYRKSLSALNASKIEDHSLYFSWLKTFLRYLSRDEARELSISLKRERELTSELGQLFSYYQQGVRSMQDVKLYPITSPAPNEASEFDAVARVKNEPSLSRSPLKAKTERIVNRRHGRRFNGQYLACRNRTQTLATRVPSVQKHPHRRYPRRLLKT